MKTGYLKKLVIVKSLHIKVAGEKPEFYITINGETLKNLKTRPTSLSAEISPAYKFKANPPPIYKSENLKDYNDYIEKYDVYFEDQGNIFFTEIVKIAYTVTFIISTSKNR